MTFPKLLGLYSPVLSKGFHIKKGKWKKRSCLLAASLGFALYLSACSVTAPIRPAISSKSAFDGKVFTGETVSVNAATPGSEAYRVFNQAGSGFVGMQSVRDDAEQRAKDFCSRKGLDMESIRETTAKPPFILGNFPKIEIVFDCVTKPSMALPKAADSNEKYQTLATLKKLLDDHAITQDEFNAEKAKILKQNPAP